MRLGVDASNIRAGGGVTYLRELLDAANPQAVGIDEVHVWSGERTLARLPIKPWLHPVHEPALDGALLRRTHWRFRSFTKQLKDRKADVLFVPGGIYTGAFHPFVAVSQNLLPFEDGERQRYGISLMRMRLELVRRAQIKTFASADGLIFTTATARRLVEEQMQPRRDRATVIPCGVGDQFRLRPRAQKPLSEYSKDRPFRWFYASTVTMYKHQWNVVAAVAALRREGMPVTLDLVGRGYGPAQRRLAASIARSDPGKEFIRYLGTVPEMVDSYGEADAVVLASSCETPSFVLLESMAMGLPIACSRRSAMPEALGEAGEYFDPENPESIAGAMRSMLMSADRRLELADHAYERAAEFTWSQCAEETMRLIVDVAQRS